MITYMYSFLLLENLNLKLNSSRTTVKVFGFIIFSTIGHFTICMTTYQYKVQKHKIFENINTRKQIHLQCSM